MRGSAPPVISALACSDEASRASLGLRRPSRCELRRLWTIAGYGTSRSRLARFAVVLFRPPIVSDTDPAIAAEVVVPPRSNSGRAAALAAAIACIVGAALALSGLPQAIGIIVCAVAVVVAVRLIERAWVGRSIAAGHVRLQDVVAERRGSGVGEAVLRELISRLDRPVVVEVDPTAAGVVAMYERLGFVARPTAAGTDEHLVMIRAAAGSMPRDTTIGGPVARWLWPTTRDAVLGAIAAVAITSTTALTSRPERLSVAVVVFVVLTAAATDWRIHRIPNVLTLTGALTLIAIASTADRLGALAVGASIMAGPLLASNVATGGRNPGAGDVKLAAVAGAGIATVASPDAVIPALVLALILGAGFGAVYEHRRDRRGFPLGPAIATATVVTLAVIDLSQRGAL